MEQRGTTVAPLADLDGLRELVSRPGPVLTAYVAFAPATEAIAEEARLRWQARRRALAAEQVPEAALAAVDEALEGAHRGAAGLAVVVPGDGGEAHVERLAVAPEEEACSAPVPALRALVAGRQRNLPHVVALVDRTGADVRSSSGGDGDDEVVTTVTGEDEVIRKVGGGGWSHRRFQQRAEDSWHHNMSQVASELAQVDEQVHPRVVAVGGDERAVGYLLDALPAAVRDKVHRIAATRAADGSEARVEDEVAAELDAWSAAQVTDALALHAEELGQGDRATSGVGRTLEALRAARVAMLLVAEGGSGGGVSERQVWVGPTADQVATTLGDLAAPDAAVAAPLLDAAVAAALASGADVMVVPPDDDGNYPETLRDGLGALLRW
jgi:Bacterial archaeo-eukaryotic release factor family 2